ncbi:hypothetical protein BH10PSE6_BH10PSE6_56300 [soil metagenome]
MKALTREQVESYRHDGFLSPFTALTAQETASPNLPLAGERRMMGERNESDRVYNACAENYREAGPAA